MNRCCFSNRILILILLLAGIGFGCAGGCQSLPRSGFDPKGERLFESCPLQGLLPSNCDLLGRNKSQSSLPSYSTTPIPQPITTQSVDGASVYSPSAPTPPPSNLLPGQFGATQPGTTGVTGIPLYGSTATAMGAGPHGINTAIIPSPDGTPKVVFEETGGYALPTAPIEGPALLMTPREQIAPIGSEVVMIASYLGSGDHLRTNEKIEWTLEGVGTLLKFDGGSICDPLHFDYVQAKKITDRYAVTKTSQLYQHLDRGTAETRDDIHLLRGQTWISVNSMHEGTTHVTAFAPSLKDWSKRTDAGIIHWVDAQWVLPRLSIAPVGDSRVLTTTVLRQTNGQPRHGWIVRYEILNGPPAGLGSTSAQIEEVETDISGQASVVLQPKENRTGTNSISVQIIRPSGADGSDRRVTVGSETLRQTWSGNAGLRVSVAGPSNVKRGEDIPCTITLTNTTSTVGKGVVVFEVPPLASFVSSSPVPTRIEGNSVLWNVEVPAKSTATIQCSLRGGTEGKLNAPVWFYPLGTTPTMPRSVTGTSVPMPPAYSDPSTATPTLPGGSSFINTPGTSGTSGGSITPPGPGATTFTGSSQLTNAASVYSPGSAQMPSLVLSIVPHPAVPVRTGDICRVVYSVRNIGNTKVSNVTLQLSLPNEYKDRTKAGIERVQAPRISVLDSNFYINLNVPGGIEPQGEAKLEIEIPDTPRQGYTFIGKVLIDNREVQQTSPQKILPVN